MYVYQVGIIKQYWLNLCLLEIDYHFWLYSPPGFRKINKYCQKYRFKNYRRFSTFNNLKMWDCPQVDFFKNFSHQSDIFKSVFRFQTNDCLWIRHHVNIMTYIFIDMHNIVILPRYTVLSRTHEGRAADVRDVKFVK